jgi:hypothetical protein
VWACSHVPLVALVAISPGSGARPNITKLNLCKAYARIQIRRGDKWKIAFRTRYRHFKYLIILFRLINAPATFQSYINEAMKDILNDFCIIYLNDIFIYSAIEEEHRKHVNEIL